VGLFWLALEFHRHHPECPRAIESRHRRPCPQCRLRPRCPQRRPTVRQKDIIGDLENNCTRQIADRAPMEIVTIKGLGSGLGVPAIAFIACLVLISFVLCNISMWCEKLMPRNSSRTISLAVGDHFDKANLSYSISLCKSSIFNLLAVGEQIKNGCQNSAN